MALDLLREPRRPVLLGVAFWVFWLATILLQVVNYGHAPLQYGLGPVVVAVALQAACWVLLPWDAGAAWWRKLAVPGLLLATLAALGLTDYSVPVWTLLIGIANATFLFGVRGGVVYAILAMVFVFAIIVAYPGAHDQDAIDQTALLGLLFALGVAAAAAFVELKRREQESRRLLDELGRSAERVRELSIAEERARIARDMHDSAGHHLTVIKMGLENAERFRTRRPREAWEEVRLVKEVTQEALDDVRRCVRALRPLSLERRSGPEAMADLAHSFAGTGLEVAFAVEGPTQALDPDAELVLYRALQEGLTNVVRHAQAQHVQATLAFADDQVQLAIEDDGRGATGPASDHGFGLTSIADRARAAGGIVSAGARASGGFALRIDLPTTPS